MHVGPGLVVRVEKTPEALAPSQRTTMTSGHDCQIVGGISAHGAFPVDDGRTVRRVEENVVPEQVAMQKRRGFVGRQMFRCPSARFHDLRLMEAVELAESGEGVSPPCLVSR